MIFRGAIGFINTDVFASPKIYISLNNSGKTAVLGSVDTIIVLAYLVVFDAISKWFVYDASIPSWRN